MPSLEWSLDRSHEYLTIRQACSDHGRRPGIGRALALGVAACGGHVIALSRTQAHLDTLKAECPSVETVTCDLTDWEATRAAVEALGPVHCLVNNAGTGYLKPFLEVNEADIDNTFDVNLKAAINVSQLVARGMVARGEGRRHRQHFV